MCVFHMILGQWLAEIIDIEKHSHPDVDIDFMKKYMLISWRLGFYTLLSTKTFQWSKYF